MKTKHTAWAGIGLLTILGHAGAKTVGHEKYTYDASGNIVEKQIDDQVTRFEYEGNLLKADSTGTAYRRDRAGRLTGESLAGQVRRELTCQFGDKVTRVERRNTRTELFYNAEGQLVGRASGKQFETLIWDGLALVGRGGEGFVTEEHPSGGSAVIAHGKVVASDYLGTTLSVGEDVFDSTAFGEGLEAGLFTGKPYVRELDSFIFVSRAYSPKVGRWNTSDPLGFPEGHNPHLYAKSDPVSRVDPLGMVSYDIDEVIQAETTGSYEITEAKFTDGTGSIAVDTIDKGNGNYCYRPVVNVPFEFNFTATMRIPPTSGTWNGGAFNIAFTDDTEDHEIWHRVHNRTLGDETYLVLENWSANYAGHEFGTLAEATQAGLADFATAKSIAVSSWNTHWPLSRDDHHLGGNPHASVESGQWVSFGSDWGGPLDAMLKNINLQFSKTLGSCEF